MSDPSDIATRQARHWPEARRVLCHPDFHHGFREADVALSAGILNTWRHFAVPAVTPVGGWAP